MVMSNWRNVAWVPSCSHFSSKLSPLWRMTTEEMTEPNENNLSAAQDYGFPRWKKLWRNSIVVASGGRKLFFQEEGSFFQAVGSDCFENVLRYLLSHGGGKGLRLLSVNWWRILASFVSLNFTSLSSTLVSFSSYFWQMSPFWLPLSWMSIPSVS